MVPNQPTSVQSGPSSRATAAGASTSGTCSNPKQRSTGTSPVHEQHAGQWQQLQHHQGAATPAAYAAGGSATLPPLSGGHQQQQSGAACSSTQLRAPPARYASHTSNLASLPRGTISSSSCSGDNSCAAGPAPQRMRHHHQQQQQHRWHGGKGGWHHHHHLQQQDEAICTCVLPRTSVLCRLLVAMTVLVVFIQAVSCGMFFCVQLPVTHRTSYVDYRDLVSDLNTPSLAVPQQPSLVPSAPASAMQQDGQQPHQQQQLQQQQRQPHQHWQQEKQQQQQQQQQPTLQGPLKAVPKLIPRVMHQTYRSRHLPAAARAYMRTWGQLNGDSWQVRFYSDEAAQSFVQHEFPEYFEAYLSLPKDVERADFFRYMVVLRLGGAYADIDAECRQPLDDVIQPADTMLVGWDTEVPDKESAAAASLARQRLVANWFFAAAPGHPVLREVCDHIARNAMSTFSRNSVRDTLERTGQGVWTDVVLKHALQHQPAKRDDPWRVRIMPRVAFGVRPTSGSAADPSGDLQQQHQQDLQPDTPGVVVLHHFMASWQVSRHRKVLQVLTPLLAWSRRREDPGAVDGVLQEPMAAHSNVSHYPVSIAFSPPFSMMTDLVGRGDVQAAVDVSASITAHGSWQPSLAPYRKPAVVEALVGALAQHSRRRVSSPQGQQQQPAAAVAAMAAVAPSAADGGSTAPSGGAAASRAGGAVAISAEAAAAAAAAGSARASGAGSASTSAGSSGTSSGSGSVYAAEDASLSAPPPSPSQGGVLVDVGAGQGFFSLAAAARGHRVVAFEASPSSVAAFRASIAYNGFSSLITLHSSAAGAAAEEVCLEYYTNKPGCSAAAAGAETVHQGQQQQGKAGAGAGAGTETESGGYGGAAGLQHQGAAAADGSNSNHSSSRAAAGSGAQRGAARRLLPPAAASSQPAGVPNLDSAASAGSEQQQQQRLRAATTARLLRRRRGYPWVADGPAHPAGSACCAANGSRVRLSDVLANATDVAALRISAHGHEGWIVEGALEYLRHVHKPDVVYVEFWPAAMRAAGYAQPAALLQQLYDMGYSDIAHAGRLCDRRWHNATRALHLQDAFSPAARMALQQPTWCKLRPENFAMLASNADEELPENVLFLLGQQPAHTLHEQPNISSRSSSSSSSSNEDNNSGSSTGRSSSGFAGRQQRG